MRAWPLALFLPFLTACAPAGAQQPMERDLFVGAGGCAAQACHGGGDPQRVEYKTWATRDRHSHAYASLSGDLGRRIGQRIGIDPLNAAECLGCHSAGDVRAAATFDRADGVSCEICHGAAGRWLGPHVAPGFKDLSPKEKEARGFRDLTTPAARAAVCVECHVGGEGRDVTHEMMAAGHPPLAFSLPRYLHDMPAHWDEKAPVPGLAAWADGAKAATAARLRQVARMARNAPAWPEFGAFDCYACHHEIRGGADARAGGRPGDFALDLAPLKALAAGDATIAGRLESVLGPLGESYPPGGERRKLADDALRAADEVERLPAADPGGFRGRLDESLRRIEAGEAYAGYAWMQQVKLLVFALAGDPESAAFLEAYGALDEALAKPYDAQRCAALARRALGAG